MTLQFRERISGQPHPAYGLIEWTDYSLTLPSATPDPRSYQLIVNGEALPGPQTAAGREQDFEMRWLWGPKEVGLYHLEWTTPEAQASIDVRVQPAHLDAQQYGMLISDLQSLPYDIVFELEKAKGVDPVQLQAELVRRAPLDELDRLTRTLSEEQGLGLHAILSQIAKDPHKLLETVDVIRPTTRVKRPSPQVMRWLARREGALGPAVSLQSPGQAIQVGESFFMPDTLLAREKRISYDNAENRLIKFFLRLLHTEISALRVGSPELLGRIEGLERQLFAIDKLCAPFLEEVANEHHPELAPTMVLAREPRYNAFYRVLLNFLRRSFVSFEETALHRPTKNVPAMYESWVALMVQKLFLTWAVARGAKVSFNNLYDKPSSNRITFSLPKQKALIGIELAPGDLIVAYYQRSYSPSSRGIHAVASRQIPDMVLERIRPNGPRSIIILDPKYKLLSEQLRPVADALAMVDDSSLESVNVGDPSNSLRPKKVDIDKMHTYRDAIRGPENNSVVRAAYIVYPGDTVDFPPELPLVGAIGARPGDALRMNTFDQRIYEFLDSLAEE